MRHLVLAGLVAGIAAVLASAQEDRKAVVKHWLVEEPAPKKVDVNAPKEIERSKAKFIEVRDLRVGAEGILGMQTASGIFAFELKIILIRADDEALVMTSDRPNRFLLLRGFDMSKKADDDLLTLPNYVIGITKTEKIGLRTYLVAEPVARVVADMQIKSEVPPPVAKAKPPTDRHDKRPDDEWTAKLPEDPRPLLKKGERLGPDDYTHWTKLYGPGDKEAGTRVI